MSILELSLSGLLSLAFMYLVITKGVKIYQRGVLDYTSRDLIGVLKKTFETISKGRVLPLNPAGA